jgi:hypothetical protein
MELSKRQLTYESDRLAAISGVAAEIQKSLILTSASPGAESQYLVGMWRQWLDSDLLWSSSMLATTTTTPPVVPRASTLPSWSWLSLSGPVSFEFIFLELKSLMTTRPPPLKIIHVACEPLREANPFGDVQAGASVTLAGYLFSTTLRSSNTSKLSSYELRFKGSASTFRPDTVLEEIDLAGPDGAVLGRTVRRRTTLLPSSEQPDILDAAVYCLFIAGGHYGRNIKTSWYSYITELSFYLVLDRSSPSPTSTPTARAANVFTRVGCFRNYDRKITKMAKLDEIVLI